jgi:hypothetical protein
MLLKKTSLLFVNLLIVLSLLAVSACNHSGKAVSEKLPLSRCMNELNTIATLAALLRNEARGKSETQTAARPLEGMVIALTINGMTQSDGDPESEIDSWCESENGRENFEKMLAALKQNNLPPTVAFINGKNLDAALAEQWLQSGNLVGNMTFSRMKARRKSAEQFVEDIGRNDQALAELFNKYQPKQRYFRYPRLKMSPDQQAREQVTAYHKQHGYLDVPATIDARSGKFSEIYCAALARGEQTCASLVSAHFKKLLLDTTLRARKIGQNRAGHEVKHILALKANQFISDNLADILAWYKGLGARFITLDEALSDPIYATVDETGKSAARAIINKTRRSQLAAGQEGE